MVAPSQPRGLCVLNQKGGVGKTTTAVNLAAALARRGERVLLIDLDPQRAGASTWLGVRDEGTGLVDALRGTVPLADVVRSTSIEGLDVIPSCSALDDLAHALSGVPVPALRLRAVLRDLPARWAWVIADCPPSLGLLTVSALVALPRVVVPVEPAGLSVIALADLHRTVEGVREIAPDVRVVAIVPSRVRLGSNLTRDVLEGLGREAGDLVTTARIHEAVRIAEAPGFGRSVYEHAPGSRSAEDFDALAVEIRERVEA